LTLGAAWQEVPNRSSLTTDGTPVTQAFDPANRPTGSGYAADADGRLTARPGASGTALEWDSLGRLVLVRATPGGTILATYTYDALDRLLLADRGAAGRLRFRYAGTTPALTGIVDDATGTVLRHVVPAPDGTVLADRSGAGTDPRTYGTNAHHDVTWVADSTGAVIATARYDPWGTLLRSSGTLPDWRFQGSWHDAVTDLAYARARWYSSALGSFISEDTLLGAPETPASRHLLAYAEGDPVNGWDPSGMYKMNWIEFNLCQANKARCIAVGVAAKWAGAYSQRASRGDIRTGNSLRHCIWSCLMRHRLGNYWARTWAWAHEAGAKKNSWDDMVVDLHNNHVGRLLGAHVGRVWLAQLSAAVAARDLCIGAFDAGFLWVRLKRDVIVWSDGRPVKNPRAVW
jgi:RHS repeat-associated protein